MHIGRRDNRIRLKLATLFILYAITATACSHAGETSAKSSSYDDAGFAMGTAVTQTIYSDNKNIATEILDILTETEEKYISWRSENSDISRINANAGIDAKAGDDVNTNAHNNTSLNTKNNSAAVSDETISYMKKAVAIADDSEGAFDPTIGKLTQLWGFDSSPTQVPKKNEIDKLLTGISYKNISIIGNQITLQNHASIDMGAIGKGIGCDNAQKYLGSRKDVKGALINIGASSILTYGQKDNEKPWKVAIQNPENKADFLGFLSLDGTNHMSTSGSYEKYFESNGKRYHHILDPATGYPAESGLIAVTVVGDNGAVCDALSTACFVLGKDKSQNLLKKYNAQAIFIDENKYIYVTDGLKNKFELVADGYENYKEK